MPSFRVSASPATHKENFEFNLGPLFTPSTANFICPCNLNPQQNREGKIRETEKSLVVKEQPNGKETDAC